MSEIKNIKNIANFELHFGGKRGWGVNSETGFRLPDPELVYGGDD